MQEGMTILMDRYTPNHERIGEIPMRHLTPSSLQWTVTKRVGSTLFTIFLCLGVMAWIFQSESAISSRRLQEILSYDVAKVGEPRSLFPLTTTDIVGFLFATLGLLIAAGGGIGGGGFLVPIYILVLGFTPKHAIPLSNVTVFGGAVANTLLNLPKRHPFADRPLIDWDIIVLMEPLTVAGAVFGANLNKLLPDKVIVVLLVALLMFTAYKTLDKACQLYQKETLGWRKLNTFEGSIEPETDESTGYLSDGHTTLSNPDLVAASPGSERDLKVLKVEIGKSAPSTPSSHDRLLGKEVRCSFKNYGSTPTKKGENDLELMEEGADDSEYKSRRLLAKILEDERTTPAWNVKIIVSMFLVVLAINLLKGGGSFRSVVGIKCGSLSFWVAQLMVLACTLAATFFARRRVLQKTIAKEQAKYTYLSCDIQWNESTTLLYPVFSAVSGVVAGMFGVGGGIVKGPLMLALGVHPAVTCATSACMILFTSFTATTAFAVFGLLVPKYAALCAMIGFFATILGQTIMNYLLRKFQRNSYIAFSIGGVVALSALCMTVESVVRIREGGPSHAPCGICST
jgi:uncharacterized membrane protein YfcA